MSEERKVLVTLSFAISGYPEDDLGEIVSAMEEGIATAIAGVFDANPDVSEEWLAERIEFYGATVSLQQPIRRVET